MDGTWEADARPGDVVRGADGHDWGVLEITREPRLSVTLVRPGRDPVTGYPPAGTPVTIVARADVPAGTDVEIAALNALAALGPVHLIREAWEA